MKNFIKILALTIFVSFSATSCILDDEALTDTFNDGSNFVSFSTSAQNLSAVADGQEYTFGVVVELQGPNNLAGMTEDVVVNVAPVASETTAVAGVNYVLPMTSITLKRSENYIATLPITVITDGIIAPLAVNPVLTLELTSTAGPNVIPSSKTNTLTFVYQCFADLSGDYLATNDGCANGAIPKPTTIEANADGSWFIAIGDGGFLGYGCTGNPGLDNFANITELCGDILPTGNLQFGSANFSGAIGDIQGGTWDPITSTLTMNHTQTFTTNWAGAWTSTYVRQ
ncbi:hypothetical protein N7U66_09050 [Lacinutrix neustonica]|uniref:DUF1735 domain-containing protein n=1 Tax=Lacinutrix neustonica TaxID=2980107 RepID=A0A9E8MZ80_9FLAO|nr:hypothetical protein [Lacinutrix neustonica]WAC03595.1 hypothetical protein N7U66_09050 [Lacinutrix neustonica]